MKDQKTEMKKEEMDLTVFTKEFDPHHRGRQCLREIKGIQANKHPNTEGIVSTANQALLLKYAGAMATRIKRDGFSLASFEKNLSEAWLLCLHLKQQSAETATSKDFEAWWKKEEARYFNKAVSYHTLRKKWECAQNFLKFIAKPDYWENGQSKKMKQPEQLENVFLPKAPTKKAGGQVPTQANIKKLLDAVCIKGNMFALRDRAIMALANDTGARIGEVLSIRNKHIKAEQDYLVITLPESKTLPRTVVSFLAKPYIEAWARVSPNKDKGMEAFFFCKKDGQPITYAMVKKTFSSALEESKIPWAKGKALHYFRGLFSSRAYKWNYTTKHYWLGWALRDHEKAYTEISYSHCIEEYFAMIRNEKNPMMVQEPLFGADTTQELSKGDQALMLQVLEAFCREKGLLKS